MRSPPMRPVLCPAARGAFFSKASTAAVGQLPFLDWEHRTVLDLDVPHDANAADLIGELHVVAPGLDARDSQALVVVDGSIAIILALVGTPVVAPRRRHLECRDRIQGEVPESNAFTVLRQSRGAHKCECDRSKQYAHPSLPQVDALHGAAEENLTRARAGRGSAPCRGSWRRRTQSDRSVSSRRG